VVSSPSGFLNKILFAFVLSLTRDKFRFLLVLIDLTTPVIFSEEYNVLYKVPCYIIFFIFLLSVPVYNHRKMRIVPIEKKPDSACTNYTHFTVMQNTEDAVSKRGINKHYGYPVLHIITLE
jgi:hypothetical protein